MGNHWWLLIAGVAVWTPMLIAVYLHFRHPDTQGCPRCHHEAGVDGSHCSEVEDNNGWSSTRCGCRNDYHWNYESVM